MISATVNGSERASASGNDGAWGICSRISLSTGFSQLNTSEKPSAILLVGHAGNSINTVLHKKWRGHWFGDMFCRRCSSWIRDPLQPFCSVTLMRSSASAALMLHQWFITFSAALLVLLQKMLYTATVAWEDWDCMPYHCAGACMHASLFFLDRLISPFGTHSCTRPKGGQGVHVPLPRWHLWGITMMLPKYRLPGSYLAYGKSLLHDCYERVMLCAVQDGCLLPRLPGIPVPSALDLEVKSGNHQLMVSI